LHKQTLQPKLSQRCYDDVPKALEKRKVFNRAQNWVSVNDTSRTASGSEFHRSGPDTEKLILPYLTNL